MIRNRHEGVIVGRGDVGYPARLACLGDAAPAALTLVGQARLLEEPLVALFCSVRVPAGAIFGGYDLARELAGSGSAMIGGFQSPMEREVLGYLLRGTTPVVICPARGMATMRIAPAWRPALEEGRLLLVSPFPAEVERPTLGTAGLRNRVVAALAGRLLILHASPGGRLLKLAREALGRGQAVHCLDLPGNGDLRMIGAVPLPSKAAH